MLVALACAAAVAAGWWWSGGVAGDQPGPRTSDRRDGRPNVLLVTLDTTRADRLGAYGFADVRTPSIDRLAADGVLFEQAVTSAPLTLPAHTSLLTGLYPPRHGVRDNGGFFVREETVTLAEQLRDHGYQTGAFVGAYVLDSRWGLSQGFETYADDFDLSKAVSASLGAVERPANEVADRALTWLEAVTPGAPFFAWVHFYDPHSPYRAPEPYGRQYAQQPYLGEIAFVDAQLGRLMAFLDQRNLAGNTVVVLVGDHGESLGEHGEATHGFFLYEATTRVPLIIRAPGPDRTGRRVAAIVRTVDLLPTLLELLQLPSATSVDGTSLVPLMTGTATELGLDAYSEAFYPRFHFGWSELLALRSGRFKYIAAPRPEVYDLADDPAEAKNLFAERRAQSQRVMTALRAIERSQPDTAPPSDMDAETRGRLAALGYIASFAAAPPRDATGLADPKDKVDLFNLMTRAQELAQHRGRAGQDDEIAVTLRKVIARDRNVIDAWLMLGNQLLRQGDFDDALGSYRQALALKPDYDLAVIGLARSYRALGREQDAVLGYRRFLEREPSNAYVRFELAQVLLDVNDLGAAESELQTVLGQEPSMAMARGALAAVKLKRGQVADAEREIRAALAEKADVRMAHFHLALIAEGRGQLDVAAQEYQEEIERFPDNHMAHFNLGKLFEQRGDLQAQLRAFRRAIEASPAFAEGHLFLAKLLLDLQSDPDQAARLARRGIELSPRGPYAPLGHYLVAEALTRQGRTAEAMQEIARGRALEAQLSSSRPARPSS